MNQHQRDTLAFLRGMLRRYRCQGGEIMITCEAAKEYEEAIARAEYELGLLDERVAALKKLAVEAISEFDEMNAGNSASAQTKMVEATKRAAARSCALQEAVAVMLDIPYDQAAEMLRSQDEA